MNRKNFLAVFAVLAMATTSQAALMLEASLSAVQPVLPSATGPLVAYDLRAIGDAGETINTITNPVITPDVGMGLHQAWAPFTPTGSPTRESQAPPLWNDAWLPYDSYMFFAGGANSVSVGGPFTETNSQVGGAAGLPNGAAGPPITGFGSYGFGPGAATKFFTAASGVPDSDVPFAQLVMKATDSVLVTLQVSTAGGEFQDFVDFCVGACIPDVVFDVGDGFADQGGYLPGALVTGGPLPTNDDDDPDQVAWSLVSLIGPDGPEVGATVDPLTGVFTWDSDPTDSRGAYTATIQGANTLGMLTPAGTDTGLMTFNLVPEPGTIAMLAMGMVALVLGRRRGC